MGIQIEVPGITSFKLSVSTKAVTKHPVKKSRLPYDISHPEFIAWDGEGTQSDGPQPYVLFGNSVGMSVESEQLQTYDMLELILETALKYPRSINVGFAFDYDVNQILADIRFHDVARLKRSGVKSIALKDKWGLKHSYRIEYRPRKYFRVRGIVAGQKVSATIYDIFTFFGVSFLKSLEAFVGIVPDLKEIQSGKANRENFTYDDLPVIRSYWQKELIWLVRLAENLKDNLYRAGFELQHWYGPGALSTYLFRKYDIAKHMARVEITEKEAKRGITATIPKEVNEAAQHAFFGGRFELYYAGNYEGDVWQFDINSAYPTAIAKLPSLSHGHWEHVSAPSEVAEFGIYRIRGSEPTPGIQPMRLPYRSKDGTIGYPVRGDGWYWSPETALVLGSSGYEIVEGWEFRSNGVRPFTWVEDMFNQRRQWKAENNPLEKALKLALNSLYGKMAQRIGWEKDGGKYIPPTFHQLEWAGWVTSFTRAEIYRAMAKALPLGKVFGVETDGFTTDVDLREYLDIGKSLGQWDVTLHKGITYIQNGLYWLKSWDGRVGAYVWKAKIRGLDRSSLCADEYSRLHDKEGYSVDEIARLSTIHRLANDVLLSRPLPASTTRFYGIGQAAALGTAVWRYWKTEPRSVFVGGGINGKRIHAPLIACPTCRKKIPASEGMHYMIIGTKVSQSDGISRKHKLPWLTLDETSNDIVSESEDERWTILYG